MKDKGYPETGRTERDSGVRVRSLSQTACAFSLVLLDYIHLFFTDGTKVPASMESRILFSLMLREP